MPARPNLPKAPVAAGAAEVSANDVGQFYIALHHRLRRMVDEAMTDAGLSLSRAKVLSELSEHGPMNQSTLAIRLGFAPRSVTDTVDSLERAGLAQRSDDPADRRFRHRHLSLLLA